MAQGLNSGHRRLLATISSSAKQRPIANCYLLIAPMKTGIIGLPQVGKTSLFKILTKADISSRTFANPREAHLGIAKVPDDRLDRLAAQYNPKKLTHASVEYV